MTNASHNSYLRDAVMTATPEQLHLMLYDGAIRFSLQARDAIESNDYETSYNKLSRAQAIIVEMQNGLRREVNPELCDRMSAIYSFLYRKLVDASVNRSIADIDDTLKILRHQRETWVMLIEKVAKERAIDEADQRPASSSNTPRTAAARKNIAEDAPAGSTLSIEG